MPVKFVVQREMKWGWIRGLFMGESSGGSRRVWVDTWWTTLATAREKYPKETFREVMTEW